MIDVAVIGGGPAGSSAALRLARAGLKVRVYERQVGAHHKVCGEFLSVEALHELRALGLDLEALGALPLGQVGLAVPGFKRAATTRLPFEGASLSREVLDEALLREAERAGAEVVRGETIRLDSEQARTAGAVFVATGKHDLPKHARPVGRQPDLIGFKMYYRCRGARPARVDLVPFDGGYAGLQPVGSNILNLCLLVHRNSYARVASFSALVRALCASSPYLAHALEAATPCWPKPLAISRIPYGFVRTESPERQFWLGDQAAVIPSFSGDGIAIALHSARRASEALLAGGSAASYQKALAGELRAQVGRATAISRLLVRPWFQPLAGLTARALPAVMRAIATGTRVAATEG